MTTVKRVDPTTEPNVAVIEVLPCAALVARPLWLTVLTLGALDAHVTLFVRSLDLPSLYLPIAANCSPVPKEIDALAGETAIEVNCGAIPVPTKTATCRPLCTLSVIARIPARNPAAVGAKTILIMQLLLAGTLLPQLFVWEKSPKAETTTFDNVVFAVFVRVADLMGLLVPTTTEPKLK